MHSEDLHFCVTEKPKVVIFKYLRENTESSLTPKMQSKSQKDTEDFIPEKFLLFLMERKKVSASAWSDNSPSQLRILRHKI